MPTSIPTVEPIRQTVVETLEYLAWMGLKTPEDFMSLAKEIKESNLNDRPCCPMCEEVQCDKSCPLESLREINVQTTNNLPSKDSVATPKKEVLESEPAHTSHKGFVTVSEQPEPVSTVIPEEVQILIDYIQQGERITFTLETKACKAIRAAYQRIADLEAQDKATQDRVESFMKSSKETITQLKSQLAAMKEIGDEMLKYVEGHDCYLSTTIAWKAASKLKE